MFTNFKKLTTLLAMMRVSLFLVLSLWLNQATWAGNPADMQGNPTDVKGLEGISFADWNVLLYAPEKVAGPAPALTLPEGATAESASQNLLSLAKKTALDTSQQVFDFAMRLEVLRWELSRKPRTPSIDQIRDLLEVIAEEVIYSGHVRFGKEFPSVFKLAFDSKLPESFSTRCSVVNGINVCNGDVIISKGNAGSSAFIARSADRAGFFSHSILAYVNPNYTRFIESEMEDGVKLRDPHAEYEASQKMRMFVYRYIGQNRTEVLDGLATSMDNWFAGEQKKFGNLNDLQLFPYNFQLDITNTEKLFCSEVAYHFYDDGSALSKAHNPYPRKEWNTLTGVALTFYNDLLTIPIREYPAPSDIELNPEYELVGMSIDLNQMQQERIDLAMVDSFMKLLEKDDASVTKILVWLKAHGNQPVEKTWFQKWLIRPGIISQKTFNRWTKDVPWGASRKQLLFFAWLNVKLDAEVRKALAAQEAQSLATQHRALDLHELRAAATREIVKSNTIMGDSLFLH